MKRLIKTIFAIAFFFLFLGNTDMEVLADEFYYPNDKDGKLIVVIDPGHGGENLGADHNGFVEKEMNMIVANAMYEELNKYEGITVYLTHTSADTDMSLQERADFAASVKADFLFCLHFNMSPDNILYGSEVWISAFGEANRQGYRFANVQLEEMREMGLFIRGIKTKFNSVGRDYYGILRFCEKQGIPAALIEHCHVDHDKDVSFCDSEEELKAFGIADATAVAKFFRLKSMELGTDFSAYTDSVDVFSESIYCLQDTTDPTISEIVEEFIDYDNNTIGVTLYGQDAETPMMYYSYSIDGGETYSEYLPWPQADMLSGQSPYSFTFEVQIPAGVSPKIVVKAINQYDRYTLSNILEDYPVFEEKVSDIEGTISGNDESQNVIAGNVTAHTFDYEKMKPLLTFLFIIALLFLLTLFITNMLFKRAARHRRRSRRRRR